jgi:hypothetical protein
VGGVAGRRLLHLCEKELFVFDEQSPESRKLVGEFTNMVG